MRRSSRARAASVGDAANSGSGFDSGDGEHAIDSPFPSWSAEEDEQEVSGKEVCARRDVDASLQDIHEFLATEQPGGDGVLEGAQRRWNGAPGGSFVAVHRSVRDALGPTLWAHSFQVPCSPLATSGGTARFYLLRLRPDLAAVVPEARRLLVGKDMSRSVSEVEFYQALQQEASRSDAFAAMMCWVLEYHGVVHLPCELPGHLEWSKRSLLVVEHLADGFEKMRLCDIKIGEETAVANWKGKGWLSAWGNHFVDERTNSAQEGFRLEGMGEPPVALRHRLAAGTDDGGAAFVRRHLLGEQTWRRFVLQRMPAQEFLTFWLDFSAAGPGYEQRAHSAVWAALDELAELVRVLAALPWPQQWVGCSVGLGVEAAGDAPMRVRARLFDWGRSELYNDERYLKLARPQQRDCIRRWRQYVSACCRLVWEFARIAFHRCGGSSWNAIVFELRRDLPPDILGSPARGASRGVPRTVLGLASMRLSDLSSPGQDVCLPLLAARHCEKDLGVLSAAISVRGCLLSGSPRTLRIDVLAAHFSEEFLWEGEALVVSAVAFEDAEDAEMYVRSIRTASQGCPTRGCACAQRTPPGRPLWRGVEWKVALEFVGLGDAGAEAARRKLANLLPEVIDADVAVDDIASHWRALLPAPLPDAEAKPHSRAWAEKIAPWLAEDESGLPPRWLLSEPYCVGEHIECYSASRGRWVPAVVTDVDLVALRYTRGREVLFKQLPRGHAHLRPLCRPPRAASACGDFQKGDRAEVFSVSGSCWSEALVIGVGLVAVQYSVGNVGHSHSKQLPATHDHLRRCRSDGNVPTTPTASEAAPATAQRLRRRQTHFEVEGASGARPSVETFEEPCEEGWSVSRQAGAGAAAQAAEQAMLSTLNSFLTAKAPDFDVRATEPEVRVTEELRARGAEHEELAALRMPRLSTFLLPDAIAIGGSAF